MYVSSRTIYRFDTPRLVLAAFARRSSVRQVHVAVALACSFVLYLRQSARDVVREMKRRKVEGGRRILFTIRRGKTRDATSRVIRTSFVAIRIGFSADETDGNRRWKVVGSTDPDDPRSSLGDHRALSWNSHPVALADRDVCPMMCQRYIILRYAYRL